MIRIGESEDIHFRHVPIVKWTCGAALLVCLILLIVGLVSAARNGSLFSNTWGDLFFWLLLIFAAVVSLVDLSNSSFLFAPLTTVDLCPRSKYVEICSTRIYGRKVERYYFSQITQFKSYRATLNFSQQYFLALVLANRKTIKLELPIGADKQETVKLIKKLNKIIRNA